MPTKIGCEQLRLPQPCPTYCPTSVIHKLLGKPVSQRRVICPQFVHDVRFKKKKPPVGGCTEY